MKILDLLATGMIDDYQKLVIAEFDGHIEKILYKGMRINLKSQKLLEKVIECGGLATVKRHDGFLYMMVEKEEE